MEKIQRLSLSVKIPILVGMASFVTKRTVCVVIRKRSTPIFSSMMIYGILLWRRCISHAKLFNFITRCPTYLVNE